ncbi:hypothetical protein [Catelliglobosispora koreensis]|uniref:hypothetical protein n=1 Tax=Catelliglobosispora koreensis TaxID=129052 RepID=UPI00035DAEDD|nr:hypothetical protein [Catelliglobosispora koreensis]
MRHHNTPISFRRRGTGIPSAGRRFVLAGQKDFYDPTNPADDAEYRIVMSYTGR